MSREQVAEAEKGVAARLLEMQSRKQLRARVENAVQIVSAGGSDDEAVQILEQATPKPQGKAAPGIFGGPITLNKGKGPIPGQNQIALNFNKSKTAVSSAGGESVNRIVHQKSSTTK